MYRYPAMFGKGSHLTKTVEAYITLTMYWVLFQMLVQISIYLIITTLPGGCYYHSCFTEAKTKP